MTKEETIYVVEHRETWVTLREEPPKIPFLDSARRHPAEVMAEETKRGMVIFTPCEQGESTGN